MGFWNIGGLVCKGQNKFDGPIFLNQITKTDITFLAETHMGQNQSIKYIEDYYCHFVSRKPSPHNNRSFGGLAILCKRKLKPYIKILENTKPDYQWVKIEESFFLT